MTVTPPSEDMRSSMYVSFRFVSFRFVSFRFVSFRFASFRFVSVRFGSFDAGRPTNRSEREFPASEVVPALSPCDPV